MKKMILMLALITTGATSHSYAQTAYDLSVQKSMSMSKTEQTFNVKESLINIRDFVELKDGKMLLELSDLHDYESFRNLDSLLRNFRRDIAFYKDSLDASPLAGMRIDYVVTGEYPFKKIRFKKYPADGNIYLNQGGDISKLKFDQDTVNIIMQKSKPGLGSGKCMIPYTVRASFVVGNYYDVDKIVAEGSLKRIVDTLERVSQSKKLIKRPYSNQLTIVYNPYYSGKSSFKKLPWLSESPYITHTGKDAISLNFNLGVGLVRNTVAPVVDLDIQFTKRMASNRKNYDFFKVFTSQYFLFDKNTAGDFMVNGNWFINAEVGSVYDGNEHSWWGKKASFGAGYLFVNRGGYFKNNTFKVFTSLQVAPRFTIMPELIATNNFKQIFPGITVKVF